MTVKVIGIHLAGEKPTAEETQRLEKWAKEALGNFDTKLIVAWDAKNRQRVIRLDAIQLTPP